MDGASWTENYAGVMPQVVGEDWNIVGIGDFNNDGKPDLVWRNASLGRTTIWYMDGANWNGNYADLMPQVTGSGWDIGGIADFNNDGNPDLVWRNASLGQTTIWDMDGANWNGSYAEVLPPVSDPAWQIIAIRDFNNDGSPDLVWRNSSTYRTTVWYMNGAAWNGNWADILPW